MDHATSSDRRGFLGLGAAALAATAAAGGAASAQTGGVPNLYPGWNAKQFRAIQAHENAHAAALRAALGASARPKATFQNLRQTSIRAFVATAQALENTGVGAYNAAVPFVFSKQVLSSAASIALIEARHAGYVNFLQNQLMSTNVKGQEQSFELALTVDEVVELATPFIAGLNGGPEPTFSTTPSSANDIRILNFALLLEDLEAEFYNVNVPLFYPS